MILKKIIYIYIYTYTCMWPKTSSDRLRQYIWIDKDMKHVLPLSICESHLHPRNLAARPWKMMVGRWVSFWDCLFLGAMLNFRGVIRKWPSRWHSSCSNWPFTSARRVYHDGHLCDLGKFSYRKSYGRMGDVYVHYVCNILLSLIFINLLYIYYVYYFAMSF